MCGPVTPKYLWNHTALLPEHTHFIRLVKAPPPPGVVFAYSGVFIPPFDYQYRGEGPR